MYLSFFLFLAVIFSQQYLWLILTNRLGAHFSLVPLKLMLCTKRVFVGLIDPFLLNKLEEAKI
jgi:hypothetical protein